MRSRLLLVVVAVCGLIVSGCATKSSHRQTRMYIMRLYEMMRCHDERVHGIPYQQQWPASDSSRADPDPATPQGKCPTGGPPGGYTNPPPPPPKWP